MSKINERIRVNFSFDELPVVKFPYQTLYFHQDSINYLDLYIQHDDIVQIHLSMCSEIGFIKSIISVYMNYYIDIDIETKHETYSFQLMQDEKINDLFMYLQKNKITIIDPLQLIELYYKYPNPDNRNKYINVHFKSWAKQYHLDNPRDNKITNEIKSLDTEPFQDQLDFMLKKKKQ